MVWYTRPGYDQQPIQSGGLLINISNFRYYTNEALRLRLWMTDGELAMPSLITNRNGRMMLVAKLGPSAMVADFELCACVPPSFGRLDEVLRTVAWTGLVCLRFNTLFVQNLNRPYGAHSPSFRDRRWRSRARADADSR